MSGKIAAISTAGMAQPTRPPDGGAPPELKWIAIDDLYVDLGYQREILAAGRRNIARIAAEFDWAFFTPVIVAPREAFFVILDGQHRTTAAKLIGKTQVPCCVVEHLICELLSVRLRQAASPRGQKVSAR